MVGKLTPNDIATASTVATIMGYNPWNTPNDQLKKAIDATEGRADDWQGNEATGWATGSNRSSSTSQPSASP